MKSAKFKVEIERSGRDCDGSFRSTRDAGLMTHDEVQFALGDLVMRFQGFDRIEEVNWTKWIFFRRTDEGNETREFAVCNNPVYDEARQA